MKILWLCNVVLPDFCDEFSIKHTNVGGWMTGMLRQLENIPDIDIGLCFPIIDKHRIKKGVFQEHQYYSFHACFSDFGYSNTMVEEFCEVLKDFQPDIIHIWGTEYNHSGALLCACQQLHLVDRVVVSIQGLVSVYAKHYALGIPDEYLHLKCPGYAEIVDNIFSFLQHGQNERWVLKSVPYVLGRTDWDFACVQAINPHVIYRYCGEILRNAFYCNHSRWAVEDCQRHTIFVSQASYPVKGFHFLIQALVPVLQVYPDTMVYVGGNNPCTRSVDGSCSPYGAYLNTLINRYQLSQHICFLGPLDEFKMIDHYLAANIFVSPSAIENSSNSICEAMFLGVPVVSSYVGGISSLIDHYRNGLCYPCDATYMLAHYIIKIFTEDALAGQLSIGAYATAHKRHDRTSVSNQQISIYKEILKRIR